MASGTELRSPTPGEEAAIGEVVRAAFGREEEADLVRRLRQEGAVIAEAVAAEPGRILGHILFSALPVLRQGDVLQAAALAPLAVVPDRQRQGVGAALVRHGLGLCRELGIPAVIVLGDPAYYARFGFEAALTARLRAPFRGPAFMALEFLPGALREGGEARYPAGFDLGV